MLYFNMEPIVWGHSRYEIITLCPMKYHFGYVTKPRLKVTTPIQALGTFLHRRKELLYKGEPGQLKLYHKSAEAFASAAKGWWKRTVARTNKIKGQKILWEFKGQPWDFSKDGGLIEELCIKTYNKCASEEPPLYVEYSRKFMLNGRSFNVRIDEIRRNYTIREYKTGMSLPRLLQLKHFPQFTFYALAFCCFAHWDEEFARICGVSEEDRKSWGGNPDYISEKVNLEYYNVKREIMLPVTHRSNQDYYELNNTLSTLESIINDPYLNVYPHWGRHCNFCQYQIPCDERSSKREFQGIPLQPQLRLFDIIQTPKFHDPTLKLFTKGKEVA